MNIKNIVLFAAVLAMSFTTIKPMYRYLKNSARASRLTPAMKFTAEKRGTQLPGSAISDPDDLKKFRETGDCVGCNLAREDLREIFKEIRAKNPQHIINLSGANLSYANISGIIASKTNFSDACMRDIVAAGAILNGAILDNTHLQRANFQNADLCKASFKGSRCGGTNFAFTSLVKANFEDALLEPSGGQVYGPRNMGSFYRATAIYANFKNTQWGCYDTTEADFTGSDFTNSTKWFGVSFKNAIMKNVVYSNDEEK